MKQLAKTLKQATSQRKWMSRSEEERKASMQRRKEKKVKNG